MGMGMGVTLSSTTIIIMSVQNVEGYALKKFIERFVIEEVTLSSITMRQ